MKLKKILFILLVFAGIGSCKKFDSMLNNPNSPTPESANADLYLTQAQLAFSGFFSAASSFGTEVSRQIVMYGPRYDNAYSPTSFDGIWTTAYTSVLKHTNALIPIAEEQKKYVNLGMAKIMKAYTLMTLVDMFGNVPAAEANLGAENTNPAPQNGKDVYASAIALLDEAIADLAKLPGAYPGNQDLFYGASNATGANRWKTLAKTLKLRAYVMTRLADPTAKAKIDALLTENDLIDTQAEDFEFKFSTKQANPNSRHPRYNGNYAATGTAGDYIGTWFMWTMVQEKGTFNNNNPAADNSDPRTRYYFYRQRTNYAAVTEQSSSCSVAPPPAHYTTGMPFCLLIAGFWGRDHGDNTGIPPDGNLRSTVGIYPAGGDFDANQGVSVGLNRGGQGAGIHPIWLSTFTEFLKAEAALLLSTAGSPRTLLESGVRKSFTKVIGFPATINVTPPAIYVPDAAKQDAYVAKVLALYDAATTNDARMEVIMKEYYIALWGNGVDIWNNYRRTGKPGNMQPTIDPNPGSFTRSMLYPSVFVNRNVNAQPKTVDAQVFWDTNPAGFIK
ncbi:MAG: SusD/RagB family nutrient-binding outer membrane lipoprotein [Chitinophagaceae bacterium]|nr:SusD/RagB family nutrient-binding outer membrane lipoprotein [Chitinophagaceae bacterium]